LKIAIESFFDKITEALDKKLPFTAYNQPESYEIKGFFQRNDDLYFTNNYSESGFVFAPFDKAKQAILFPLSESHFCITTFSDISIDENNSHLKLISNSNNEKSTFVSLVQKGVEFLKKTGVKKVVLSRKELIKTSHFNIEETFKNLLMNYRSAMVYVWFHPKIGLWFGATPETLLNVKGKAFTTMALAGTQLYDGSLEVDWQHKEKQEQQFVTDYIINNLSNSLAITGVSEPHTIRAGNLLHLRTKIKGILSRQISLYQLIGLLHPTPAVCGLPKKEAKEFILENENYDREFYTGYVGELNIESQSNLYVNLRCMQVLSNEISIYIGSGITVDSIPEKEWEETKAKTSTLIDVLIKKSN
jgi:isochorismate synthase